MPVLVTAHTVNNLCLGDELQNEGYESDQNDFKSLNKMSDLFKNTFQYILLHKLKCIPWTQKMSNEAVHIESRSLAFIPDRFKTQEMCIKAVEIDPYTLKYVPVYLRTQEICERAVEKYLYPLKFVPGHLKT